MLIFLYVRSLRNFKKECKSWRNSLHAYSVGVLLHEERGKIKTKQKPNKVSAYSEFKKLARLFIFFFFAVYYVIFVTYLLPISKIFITFCTR